MFHCNVHQCLTKQLQDDFFKYNLVIYLLFVSDVHISQIGVVQLEQLQQQKKTIYGTYMFDLEDKKNILVI